jgi:hypothetical protein
VTKSSPSMNFSQFCRLGHVQWPLILMILLVELLEVAGFFSPPPQHLIEVLHSVHMLVLTIGLAAVTLLRFAIGFGERQGFSRLLVQIALLLFCAAIWTSRATHFEGKSIRFEGQGMQGLMGDYVRPSVYGRSLKMPALGFQVNRLRPETDGDGNRLRRLTADITLSSSWSKILKNITITSRMPLFTAWTFVRMTDFGYATRFSMSDLSGNQVDSDYQYLKLFPPGAEDSFVPFTYGYTIYLRLYPDYYDKSGAPASRSAEPENPLFKVRIVRHKDIIYNDYMKIGEHLRFDDAVFQLHDVIKWAEFTLVKDGGIFVALGGIICLVTSCIISLLSRRRTGSGGGAIDE